MTGDRSQKTEDRGRIFVFCLLFFVVGLLVFPGCGPKYTYPAGKVPESVEKISKEEYSVSLTARVVGKTLGARAMVDNLINAREALPKEVHELMGKGMQALSRVALSTDLPLDFCTLVVYDKNSGSELLITRSVDDTRRANADAIGIEESMNRTVFSQRRALKTPAGASPRPFVLQNIRLEDFLAEQIAQRARFVFMGKNIAAGGKQETKALKEEEPQGPLVLTDGSFEGQGPAGVFRFSLLSMKADNPRERVLNFFKIVSEVLAGYRFEGFDSVEIVDYISRQKLLVDRRTLLDYRMKRITGEQILDRFLTESRSIQEAFKLFGLDNAAPAVAKPSE